MACVVQVPALALVYQLLGSIVWYNAEFFMALFIDLGSTGHRDRLDGCEFEVIKRIRTKAMLKCI